MTIKETLDKYDLAWNEDDDETRQAGFEFRSIVGFFGPFQEV